jgi:hypothetical protein
MRFGSRKKLQEEEEPKVYLLLNPSEAQFDVCGLFVDTLDYTA